MKISLLTLVSALLFNLVSQAQLSYFVYEGAFSALPNYGNVTSVKSGNSNNVDISVRTRETNYSLLWTGNVYITTEGDYTFETISDDGSKFVLANKNNGQTLTVDNDGLHGVQSRKSSIHLPVGTYPIAIGYFQGGGGQAMEVYYSSNTGISRQRIPDALFFPSNTTTPPPPAPPVTQPTTPPANTSGNLYYEYVEGNWSGIPDFSSLQKVKKGNVANVDLSVRGRDSYYAIQWSGSITVPAAGYYTFETYSDDGSKFVVADKANNNVIMVNNDGLHGEQSRTAGIQLAAGTYPISISYLQGYGGQT
ncbi:MAG: PA14 domain-containing protein, partial [Chitinophagaceae bacterium]